VKVQRPKGGAAEETWGRNRKKRGAAKVNNVHVECMMHMHHEFPCGNDTTAGGRHQEHAETSGTGDICLMYSFA